MLDISPILLFLLELFTYFAQRNAHFFLVPILLKILLAKFINAYRSPMGLPQVAGISRWPHFRVPRDTRGYNRDSVTCIFSSMQGHCDWFVASLAVTVNNQSVLLVARYQYQARLAKDLAAYCGRSFGFEAANKNHLFPLLQTKK